METKDKESELFQAIKTQIKHISLMFSLGEIPFTIPVKALRERVRDVETAFHVFQDLLGRENLSVNKISRDAGEDSIPQTLFVTELDRNTVLAIGNNVVYYLDRRVYQVTNHYRHNIAEIIKIENHKRVAEYHQL